MGYKQKMRIKLRSYDYQILDYAAKQIVETAKIRGATVSGPTPLPTDRKLYCVLRSPHVDKDSREHFEMRIHKRLIEILDPTPEVIQALTNLLLPAGVDILVRL